MAPCPVRDLNPVASQCRSAACFIHGKRTVVVVLHEVNYAAAHADHIVALRDGCVAGAGRPAELLTAGAISDLFGTPVTVSTSGGRPVVHHFG